MREGQSMMGYRRKSAADLPLRRAWTDSQEGAVSAVPGIDVNQAPRSYVGFDTLDQSLVMPVVFTSILEHGYASVVYGVTMELVFDRATAAHGPRGHGFRPDQQYGGESLDFHLGGNDEFYFTLERGAQLTLDAPYDLLPEDHSIRNPQLSLAERVREAVKFYDAHRVRE